MIADVKIELESDDSFGTDFAALPLLRAPGEMLRMDHIGIAVRSLATAAAAYEALGMLIGATETVEHEQVRVAMIRLVDSRMELIEPMVQESVIGRFIAKRGEGLHHVALRTEGIFSKFDQLRQHGVRLVSDAVRSGAGGHGYFFVHPASAGGVLIEIVGDVPPGTFA